MSFYKDEYLFLPKEATKPLTKEEEEAERELAEYLESIGW